MTLLTWNLFVIYLWATLQNKAELPQKNNGNLYDINCIYDKYCARKDEWYTNKSPFLVRLKQ